MPRAEWTKVEFTGDFHNCAIVGVPSDNSKGSLRATVVSKGLPTPLRCDGWPVGFHSANFTQAKHNAYTLQDGTKYTYNYKPTREEMRILRDNWGGKFPQVGIPNVIEEFS